MGLVFGNRDVGIALGDDAQATIVHDLDGRDNQALDVLHGVAGLTQMAEIEERRRSTFLIGFGAQSGSRDRPECADGTDEELTHPVFHRRVTQEGEKIVSADQLPIHAAVQPRGRLHVS